MFQKIQQLNFLKYQIQKIAEENNFQFIDGTKKFNEEHIINKIFFYALPTHFNEKGYEMLAEDLYEKIIKQFIIFFITFRKIVFF